MDKVNSETKIPDAALENIKVVELKKKLKALGLPLVGNKSELMEELQEVMLSGKGIESSAVVDFTLLPDNSPQDILEDDLLEDSIPEKENKLSVSPSDHSTSSELTTVTLTKRVLVPISSETVKGHKKIVINKNNFPTPKYVLSKPVESETGDEIKIGETDGEEKKVDKDLPYGVIRLSAIETKNLTDKEKIILRAKRFNITSPEPTATTEKVLKLLRKEQMPNSKSNASTLTTSNAVPNLELLKKRAQRFGENVSSIMKQLEDHEKILKRKFTDSKIKNEDSNTDDPEKIKKRAERFGL